MATLPAHLVITVFGDLKPIGGQFVRVVLGMTTKNDFSVLVGPSTDSGQIEVTREMMLRECAEERRLFIMDYADPETAFSGTIRIVPLGRADLGRALNAYRQFQSVTPYPPGHERNLESAVRSLDQTAVGALTATVDGADFGSLNILCEEVRTS
jgi:hypothetical protein